MLEKLILGSIKNITIDNKAEKTSLLISFTSA